MTKFVIANWKMNLGIEESARLAAETLSRIGPAVRGLVPVFCPTFAALGAVRRVVSGTLAKLGAQDVFWQTRGAFTGEVSVRDLTELGVEYVIIGHSERRAYLYETDPMVRRKVELVMRTLITPVLCVGETRAEQKAGKRDSVLTRQLKAALSGIKPKPSEKIIVAYEPVWAIGTGLVSDPTEAEDAHEHIRRVAAGILGPKWSRLNLSVIYGGSVDSKNVRGFVAKPGIDGVLVGGASLKAVEFSRIANSFAHQTEIRRLAVGGELPA